VERELIKHFHHLLPAAEICGSVVVQLLLNDVANPFALALVDVPSGGKTITLNLFNVEELIYTTDNFTPASFVSHASNVSKANLAKVDLLPRIRFKTLIVRDLAPIFGAKNDDLLKSLGILTRVLDGEGLQTDGGVHGQRGYKGDYPFMMLAATTPISPRIFKIMGTLGGRLFFLRLHSPDKSEDELAAQNVNGDCKQKERICQAITSDFIRGLWAANPNGIEWNKASDPEDCMKVIARCAKLLAHLRGVPNGDPYTDSPAQAVIEKPDRINTLLYNLARGHAILCGRRQITKADLIPVVIVALDSAPDCRGELFRALVQAGGKLKTSEVEARLGISKPTAINLMEDFATLGAAKLTQAATNCGRPELEITLAEAFAWFGGEEFKKLSVP